MELNRRTKLAGGILALAVAALLYDRLLAGGGPATAEAAPTEKAQGAPKPEEVVKPENTTPRGALAERLAQLELPESAGEAWGPGPREDVFVAPVAWFPSYEPAAEAVRPVARAGSRHVINSVMMNNRDRSVSWVVIDGKPLRPGVPVKVDHEGKVRTYELVRAWVGNDNVTHVEFTVDGYVQELTYQIRSGGGPGAP